MEAISLTDVIAGLTALLVALLTWQAQRVIGRLDRIEEAFHEFALSNGREHATVDAELRAIRARLDALEEKI
jgi:hypothetical protein